MSYQAPPPGYPMYQRPDHPRATTALVLGLLGILVCAVCSPFAWSIGGKAMKEIDASGGTIGGRGQAQAGFIMGIIGTVILGLGVIGGIIWVIIMIAAVGSSSVSP